MSTPSRPASAGAAPAQQFAETRVFSLRGRIGRVRYLAYLIGVAFAMALALIAAIIILVLALGQQMGEDNTATVAGVAGFVVGLLIAAVGLVFGVRRLNDMDFSGWWILLSLIPVINVVVGLALMVVPGTRGDNRFGPPPPPNSTGAILMACSFVLVPILGIVAAVAIPSYQDYTARAGVVQGLVAVAPVQRKIEEAAAAGQPLPQSMADLGFQDDASFGPRIESIILTEPGTLAITFQGTNPQVDGKAVLLTPRIDADGRVIGWQCSSEEMRSSFLPGTCKY